MGVSLRLVRIIALSACAALGGCGVKGALEPPPGVPASAAVAEPADTPPRSEKSKTAKKQKAIPWPVETQKASSRNPWRSAAPTAQSDSPFSRGSRKGPPPTKPDEPFVLDPLLD